MPWAAAAVVAGAGISANSAKKASKGQQQAAGQSLEEQKRQFDISRGDLAPYRDIGTSSLNRIADLMKLGRAAPVSAPTRAQFTSGGGGSGGSSGIQGDGNFVTMNGKKIAFDPVGSKLLGGLFGKKKSQPPPEVFDQAGYDAALEKYNQDMAAFEHRPQGLDVFEADPGYQFRLGEGNKSIENASRARGMYYSPSTVKELTRYGQGFASNEFGNVYNRLAGLAGTGQTATNTSAQLGQNYAGNVGNINMGAANARGAAAISQGNTWGNALSSLGNNYNQQQTLGKLFKNQNQNYFGNQWYPQSGFQTFGTSAGE